MAYGIVAALLVTALLASLGVWWYRRRRREPDRRLISFVGLLRAPKTLDTTVLAKTAGRVWNADVGDGDSSGSDGFVAGRDFLHTIFHGGRAYLINSFARPYFDDVDAVADSIPDLRIKQLIREHSAWCSFDAMGVNAKTPETEVAELTRRLAKLFAQFLDEDCLLIYVPDTQRTYPVNDETQQALLADDPLTALQETQTLPIIQISPDDPRMLAAVAKARSTWPEFVAAFEAQAGENFGAKAPVSHGDNTEFIWLEVTAIEGDRIYGTLANEPGDLGPLKLGSRVSVSVSDLNDWCYVDSTGDLKGGFTVAVVMEAANGTRRTNT
jgi:uncharacterized protein YegJ (DUF2314 family)